MEETAQNENQIRSRIAQDVGVESVTPAVEEPLDLTAEIAEVFDVGGKTEGDLPSGNFFQKKLEWIKKRWK